MPNRPTSRPPRRASSSDMSRCMSATSTTAPSGSRDPFTRHCQSWERLISAVATSSMRLLMAAAPLPRSQLSRYWSATLTLSRTPSSVMAPPGTLGSVSAAAVARASSRSRSFWFGRSPSERIEHLPGDRHEVGMGHPGAVEAVARLALLVLADLLEGQLRDLGLAPVGDERAHAADGVRAAPVAGTHEGLRIGPHEGHGHRHLAPVWQDHLGALAVGLDEAEDVVPAAGVQARRVVAQLVEDLLHLEGGPDGLDEHGRADRPDGDAKCLLTQHEGVVPEAGLEMRLELGEVVVGPEAGPRTSLERGSPGVREVKAEVEEAGRDRFRRRRSRGPG